MQEITDDFMKEMLTRSKNYLLVILKAGPQKITEDQRKIVWEHGRRNFELRAKGLLSIVCPVSDDSDVKGIGIFNASKAELKKIMDEDPGVSAGIFTYEILSCRSFPGDMLPV
jgi:hypothetical protein